MIEIKRFSPRVLAVILIMILLMANYMVINTQPKENAEVVDSDVNQNIPLSRSTRADDPWPMYLNNPAHTSYSLSSGPTTNDVFWYNSTGNPTYSSPCVANGKVFIGADEAMNAFYISNGTLAWRTQTIQPVTGTFGVACSPAYSQGFVYFGGDRIYCLYENNGTIKWRVDDPGNYKHGDGSPTIANGKVFIGGSDRRLYSIDQYTGEILWTFQTLSSGTDNWGLYAAPAVVDGFVYLSACDGYLYQLNESQPTATASAYHIFDMAYASYFSPLVVNGRVYVGTGYDSATTVNRLYCLDSGDLSLIWEFYPGYPVTFLCSAGYYNNRIYVGSTNDSGSGNLYCLDALGSGGTTTIFWQFNIHNTWSTPAITNDRLYIGSKDNYVYCLNLTQTAGSEEYLWRYNTQGDVDSSFAVSNGQVYVGSHGNGGRLYCFGNYVETITDYITLKQGWNLISIPLNQDNQDLENVLENIDGYYDAVQWYDVSDSNDPWKHHKVGKPYGNDLTKINESMGFWVHITEPGETIFLYNGTLPTENQTITLHPGWNQVGYPSKTVYNRTEGLKTIDFGSEVDRVQWFEARTQMWYEMGSDDNFEPTRGYWIHAKTQCLWEVPL